MLRSTFCQCTSIEWAALQAIEILYHVQEQRGDEDEAVDAVEKAAMSRDRGAQVFHADVPFDDADRQVAELSADADDQAGQRDLTGGKCRVRKPKRIRQRDRKSDGAKRALPRFVGADIAAQRMLSKQPPERKGGHIIQLRREQDI